MLTFTYIPSTNFSSTTMPRVYLAKFGEGYSQRTGKGINAINKEWSLSFNNRKLADAKALIEFLEARAGIEPFLWTPVGEVGEIVVVAPDWKEVYTSPISRTITTKFEKVYGAS